MNASGWLALWCRSPLYELSREDGIATSAEMRRRQDGIVDANKLSPQAAIDLARSIKVKALKASLSDSTAMIRADRDGR